MPDTKLDEAIALARRIIALGDRILSSDTRELARALLDATAPGAQYRAGMEAALAIAEALIVCGGHIDTIRAAIAALPASPEPAPVAMPELRWEGYACFLGPFLVGEINPIWADNGDLDEFECCLAALVEIPLPNFSKEMSARTAVEAAVRERLGMGAVPVPSPDPAPGKLICREQGGSIDVTGACRLCGSWEGEACGQKLSQEGPEHA